MDVMQSLDHETEGNLSHMRYRKDKEKWARTEPWHNKNMCKEHADSLIAWFHNLPLTWRRLTGRQHIVFNPLFRETLLEEEPFTENSNQCDLEKVLFPSHVLSNQWLETSGF